MFIKLLIFLLAQISNQSQPEIYFIERTISLPTTVSSFSINDLNQIYVIDNKNNELIKLSRNGRIIKTIGGYGWSDGLFDDARAVYATQLEVFAADYGNHRIQKFDKDLNFIGKFSISERELTSFKLEYPISIDLSTLGDLYILDSKNKRVIKLNGFNKVERIFGGFESGDIFLNNPTKIRADANQQVYVLDGYKIKVFDQFGTPMREILLNENRINDFGFHDGKMFLASNDKLFQLTTEGIQEILIAEKFDTPIKEIKIKSASIYLLFGDEIKVLRRGK